MKQESRIRRQSREPEVDEKQEASDGKTLTEWLLERYPEIKNVGDDPQTRPGIVHRLDKDTSGIMLVPKTQAYFDYLKKLFQEHKIKKIYQALACGMFKEKTGVINKPIGIKDGTIKRSVYSDKMAKEAITEYRVLKTYSLSESDESKGYYSLLEVTPKTGRTHQIRIHLSSIGHPILGDMLYGNKPSKKLSEELGIKRQMLHAVRIELETRPGERVSLEADMPEDMEKMAGSYPQPHF